MKIEQLFSEREAADLLCLSIPTLKKWRYSNRIPYIKLGNSVRYSESQLEKLLAESQRELA